jgi:hypothetical protein
MGVNTVYAPRIDCTQSPNRCYVAAVPNGDGSNINLHRINMAGIAPTLISSSLLGLRSRATPDVVVANDKVVMVVQPTTATTGVGNTGEQMASIQIVRFEAAAT